MCNFTTRISRIGAGNGASNRSSRGIIKKMAVSRRRAIVKVPAKSFAVLQGKNRRTSTVVR